MGLAIPNLSIKYTFLPDLISPAFHSEGKSHAAMTTHIVAPPSLVSTTTSLIPTCPPLTYYANHADTPVVVVLNHPSLCLLPTPPPIVAHGSLTLTPDDFPTSIFHSTSRTHVTVIPPNRPYRIPTKTLAAARSETSAPLETPAPTSSPSSNRKSLYLYLLVLILPVALGILYAWSVWITNRKTRREDRQGMNNQTPFSRANSYARWLRAQASKNARLL
ncbi:hypothetical protein EV426DRAFT_704723 [Tirmania nivea]|nr:hypothetical protein EV426DRAFT_704723 [Tirmania nivea]